jgi:alpha-L-rhamnosidase
MIVFALILALGIANVDWTANWIGKDEPGTMTSDQRLTARWLRRDFVLDKRVRRADIMFSGLGSSELYLNGHKVGDAVLSPALSDYTKRVYYVSYDVTGMLKRGTNDLMAVLGNGRFFAPRQKKGTTSYGFPKMRLQMRIDFTDGTSTTIVSDQTWKLARDGPILANNEYDGEEFDARKQPTNWEPAQIVEAPGGVMSPQAIAPIRVTGSLKPVSMKEVSPGVFIYDMGQNMVGWCRLRVKGPAGKTVTMRFAETLKPDGTLYLANIRGAKVTDKYTLAGQGAEMWEPRFTYHGFRYVELTGFPGKPTLATLEGRVVNDDLEPAGSFRCSNPVINRIYTNIMWGVRGNYRSIPTDCPQRDERQGWMGDRSEESRGEAYFFQNGALYAKWVQDMIDAQRVDGSVPDVCPPYWLLYHDDVTWPASLIIIPGTLLDMHGDRATVEHAYPAMVKWIDHMSGYITNNIMSRDKYGDWCVPPEDPKLIHSKDPARKTAGPILGTTYFYRCLQLMTRYANLLGKPDDAQRFAVLADKLKDGLNATYLNRDAGRYDNGAQTTSVLPLAFGMVPDDLRQKVFDHLVDKITNETHGHIGTGLVGGQWLNRVLSDNGRPDLSYAMATNTTYPSWGYMTENGATTIWELWNGNTADPAMNSGNHVMLVGDLVIWFYEYLAGIRPDPEHPGFEHIIIRPTPTGDLSWVEAHYDSVRGRIISEWKRVGDRFTLTATIPAKTTATVYLPDGQVYEMKPGRRQFRCKL